MQSGLPPKLYFRIGEVAGLVGVEPHVLRYWEREFRSIRPTKSAKGQRVYSRRDVENLLRVRNLLYAEGFTIAGAKKRLQKAGVEVETKTGQAGQAGQAEQAGQVGQIGPVGPKIAPQQADAGATGATSARSSAPKSSTPTRVREKLTALRAEVQSFLEEIGG